MPALSPPGAPPRNRFDDPDGQFRVRYLATTLRGALLEVLAGFRTSASLERRLADVSGVADETDLEPPGTVPAVFLARLRVARIGPRDPSTWFVDVTAVETHTVLGTHPQIAGALAASALGNPESPPQLDAGTIALGGPVGRRLTQAVARTIYTETDAGGIRYTSRVDAQEECWAVFDNVEVWSTSPEPLPADDPALYAVCIVLGLRLP